jgi:hypothetical protein
MSKHYDIPTTPEISPIFFKRMTMRQLPFPAIRGRLANIVDGFGTMK